MQRPENQFLCGFTTLFLALVLFLSCGHQARAQSPTPGQPWAYVLTQDSYLLDDCPLCDHLTAPVPMRGTFDLRLVAQNPLFSSYAVENVQFTAGSRPYVVVGGGTLQIGGEVAVQVKMNLQLEINDGTTNKVCYFTNDATLPGRNWPMLDITVQQTNGAGTQLYTLRLAAAPVREIWFSTATPFVASAGPFASNYIQAGDLISTSGRVVKRNSVFFTSVGAYPPAPDLGLDAVDVLPGGEIAFALGSDIDSFTLGLLHHGDLMSTKGRIIARNNDLLAAFLPQPSTNDLGLDAVDVLPDGGILFSIQTNVYSAELNTNLWSGDLLSSDGSIARRHEDLLARFSPPNVTNNYGLKSLYIWPSGETWFSVESGFVDKTLGAIQSGDLLSDQGYIVFRNLDLLSALAPMESVTNFGLHALYVITDATASAPPPTLAISGDSISGNANLSWESTGRVFQIERADQVDGPFTAFSPIAPDLTFADSGALTNRPQSFYRLRQW